MICWNVWNVDDTALSIYYSSLKHSERDRKQVPGLETSRLLFYVISMVPEAPKAVHTKTEIMSSDTYELKVVTYN